MKFACSCGEVIADSTDYLPHKGHLISDQDLFDALDLSRRGSADWFVELTRRFYECETCGRLWIENETRELVAYGRDGHSTRVLFPARGERWRASLRAEWSESPAVPGSARGLVHCARGARESTTTYDTWEALERAYHETLAGRRAEGTLRDAMLAKDGAVVHRWEEAPEE